MQFECVCVGHHKGSEVLWVSFNEISSQDLSGSYSDNNNNNVFDLNEKNMNSTECADKKQIQK
jgi:hypothetical protein